MVTITWNSNQSDLQGSGIDENFARLSAKIAQVHMRDVYIEEYPWRRLIGLLSGKRFTGYCCAGIRKVMTPSSDVLFPVAFSGLPGIVVPRVLQVCNPVPFGDKLCLE
jgi:hypothetical protein